MSDTESARYGQDLSQTLTAVSGKRDGDLETTNSLQGLSRALLQNEVRRLAGKRSVKISQRAKVQAKLDRTLTATKAIKAQKEEIIIKRPVEEEKALIVEGRVVSLDDRGLPGLSVALGQPNGSVIIAVKPQTTDRQGHYVFRLDEEVVAEIKEMIAKGIHVLVLDKSGELIGKTEKTFTLKGAVNKAPTIILRRKVIDPRRRVTARPARPARTVEPARGDDLIRPQAGGVLRQPVARPVITAQPGRRLGRISPLILAAKPPAVEARETARAAGPPAADAKAQPRRRSRKPAEDTKADDSTLTATDEPDGGAKAAKDEEPKPKRRAAKPRRRAAKPGRKPKGGSGR